MEHQPQNQHENPIDDAKRREQQLDEWYKIELNDIEDMTLIYPVVRSEQRDASGGVISPRYIEEGWMLVGVGEMPRSAEDAQDDTKRVEVGKFQRFGENGEVLSKWLPMEAQNKLRAEQLERRRKEREHLKLIGGAVVDLARESASIDDVDQEKPKPFVEDESSRTKTAEEARQLIDEAHNAQVAIESPEQASHETLRKALDALTEGLSETDKQALWFYANAISSGEEISQMKKMSLQAQDKAKVYRQTVQTYRSK